MHKGVLSPHTKISSPPEQYVILETSIGERYGNSWRYKDRCITIKTKKIKFNGKMILLVILISIFFKNGHGGNRTPISWALRKFYSALEPGSLPLAYAPCIILKKKFIFNGSH
ncbi:hypothetical protein HY449_00845 [Candidatus Pacearchaeota archaeon]|nr:hypothetical protein [Candidatus Pacearchaeota archaeon]